MIINTQERDLYLIRHPATLVPDISKLPADMPLFEVEDNLGLSGTGHLQGNLLAEYLVKWASKVKQENRFLNKSVSFKTSPLGRARCLAEKVEKMVYPVLKDSYKGIEIVKGLRELDPNISVGQFNELTSNYSQNMLNTYFYSHPERLSENRELFDSQKNKVSTALDTILDTYASTILVFGHARNLSFLLWLFQQDRSTDKIGEEDIPDIVRNLEFISYTSISMITINQNYNRAVKYIGRVPHLSANPELIGGTINLNL